MQPAAGYLGKDHYFLEGGGAVDISSTQTNFFGVFVFANNFFVPASFCEQFFSPSDCCGFHKFIYIISSLYVCMAIKYIIVLFVETPRNLCSNKFT